MITLDQIKPIPIFEGDRKIESDTWASDCTFKKGKKYLVTAPSGRGKSTLVHIIYGLRNDYSGNCLLDEQNTNSFSRDNWAEIRQEKLSIVFQDLRLFLKMTAMENILLKSSLRNYKTKEEIEKMAELLGIENLMHKKTDTLSYGQRQRVALIRSLCQPFDFLLLDEPFSHLDEKNITIATKLINTELLAQKAGLILVSLGEAYFFKYDHHFIL